MKNRTFSMASIFMAVVLLFTCVACPGKQTQTTSGNIPLVVPVMAGPGELGLAGTVTEFKATPQKRGRLEKNGVIIAVPAGAVSEDKTVILKECTESPPHYVPKTGEDPLPGAISLSKTFDLGPDGISFDKPVTITLPFDKTLLEEGVDSRKIVVVYYNGQNWVSAGGLVDRQKGTVTVSMNKFPGLVVEVALLAAIAAGWGYTLYKTYEHVKGDPISDKTVSSHITPNDPKVVKYTSSSVVVNYEGRTAKSVIPLEDPAKPGQVNPEFINHLKNASLNNLDRIAFERYGDRGFNFPNYDAKGDKFQWFKPDKFFAGDARGDCTSISSAYLSIFRKLGIEAYGVDGYKDDLAGDKRHAWVEFYLDGEVYYYDHEEGIKRLKDIEKKLTRPSDIKGEGYMWNEKGQKKYVKSWWTTLSAGSTGTASSKPAQEIKTVSATISPASLTGEINKEYSFSVQSSASGTSILYEWYVNSTLKQSNSSNIFKTSFTAQGDYTIAVKLKDSAGKEIGTASSKVTIQAPAQQEYSWKLVEVVDYENKESWDLANKDPYWKFDYSCAQGSFEAKTWHKDEKDYVAYGSVAAWSAPPKVIKAGEKVTLTASLSETENTHKNSASAAATWADFAPPGRGIGSRGEILFKNAAEATDISINGFNKPSASDTFSAVARAGGKPGERIALRQVYYMGNTMATYYVYEWQAN